MQEKLTNSRSWVTCTKHNVEHRLGELRKPTEGIYKGHAYIHYVGLIKPVHKPIIWAVAWHGENSYNFILNDDDKPYVVNLRYVNFMHIVESHLVFEDSYEVIHRRPITGKLLTKLISNINTCLEHAL